MTDFRGQVKNALNCGKMKKTILISLQRQFWCLWNIFGKLLRSSETQSDFCSVKVKECEIE